MGKRIFLFIVTNIAIVLTLSIVAAFLGRRQRHRPVVGSTSGRWRCSACSGVWAARSSRSRCRDGSRSARPASAGRRPNRQQPELDWLYETIERLTQQANLPMPEVGIYESPEVNAFATGPSKSRSLVAVSTGLLRSMRQDEVEGVLGSRGHAHRQRRHGDDDAAAGRHRTPS